MPANLHIEVRVALLRDGKSIRSVSREAKISDKTIFNVITGRCGTKKDEPSVAAVMVLRALMPWLPATFAADLRKEFPGYFAAPKAASRKGARS